MARLHYETVLLIDLVCLGVFVLILLLALGLMRLFCRENCCLCVGHWSRRQDVDGDGDQTPPGSGRSCSPGPSSGARPSRDGSSQEGALLIPESVKTVDCEEDKDVIT